MGQEIARSEFSDADRQWFARRLSEETEALCTLAADGGFSDRRYVLGAELEAWLVDRDGRPAALNEAFLDALNDPCVVPELSRYNIELNCLPRPLGPGAIEAMHAEMSGTWERCRVVAQDLGADLACIGILPTLRPGDLGLASMSGLKRYVALNRQVLQQRQGEPVHIRIDGAEALAVDSRDVMLEAATTSFQVHLQVPAETAARHYNAALVAAGPLLAVAVNSPLLFGRSLWEETRIPLFEQSVEIGGFQGLADASVRRVGFGQGYVRDSLLELFVENLNLHPVLLPMRSTEAAERFPHLRLHNGCIWRWVRPLLGFDDAGRPHLRIEQRVLPSGPSFIDMLANAALAVGLTHALAVAERPPEAVLAFSVARDNFYAAARHGAAARLRWLDGRRHAAATLVLDHLLPLADAGLRRLSVSAGEAERYLSVVAARVRGGRSGSAWQRARLDALGGDVRALMHEYLDHQRSGAPVHEWPC